MLTPEVKKKCIKLDAKLQEFRKRSRPAIILILAAFVVGFGFLIWLPVDADYSDYPLQSYSVGIFVLVAILVAWFLIQQSNRFRTTGYAKNVVKTFRAYSFLEKYLEDDIISHLDKAESEMDSLLTSLQTEWGDLSEKNPSFKSLLKPIEKFIKNIDMRLIPAITNEGEEDVIKIKNTLESLIMFFLSDDLLQIEKINDELESFPDVSEEEESTLEKIKQNKHLVTFLFAFLIIGGGLALSQSTKFIKEDFSVETQLLIWVGISVPFTVWMLHARYKK